MAADHVAADLLGRRFRFHTAPGLFCADRVDEGTQLLLDNLPGAAPTRVLDLGCGYGALGLPVAARYPDAQCLLVDRDTLAVEASARNGQAHGLQNVEARPSLGYRDVGDALFDWILCNVPARIGTPALRHFLQEGSRRLSPKGELRVVVIRDLLGELEASGLGTRLAEGPRHAIYALGAAPSVPQVPALSIYTRDAVLLGGLRFERPTDLAEEPGHDKDGLPLLLELLPKNLKEPACVWRGGYGAVAVALTARGASVICMDRDLLLTAFTQHNAERLGWHVQAREAPTLVQALGEGENFTLVVGELHPTAAESLNQADVLRSVIALRERGSALWLGRSRQGQRLFDRLPAPYTARAVRVASRGDYAVWRLQRL